MTQTRKRKNGNPDLRRQQQTPSPSLPQIEEELTKYLQPSLFTQLKYLPGNNDKPMRDRLLNLPVMVALILSLVYRQIAGLSEAVRVLKEEGLLWVESIEFSKQALSKRLKISEDNSSKLGGKIMIIVEAFNQNPVKLWY